MPGTPFRELLTLSDAVELIGRRLYGETWTGWEYQSQPRKSPEEIASERKPLEEELATAEAEIQKIEAAIQKSIDAAENRRLAKHREKLETRVRQLLTKLSLDHPLNALVRDAYETRVRWQTATETLLAALRGFKLRVHDGRGRELNQFAWSNPKFRYYLDLSLVVVPRTAREPRWQAARIDRDPFENWLATLTPLVEVPRELSPQERLTEFLRQQIAVATEGSHKRKGALRKEALKQTPGATGRMFDRVWSTVVPPKWHKSGAPRRARRSR